MKNNFVLYKHTSPNNKVYIGITSKKPEYRWNNGKGYKYNKHFYNAIQKYGWDNFEHDILIENLTEEEAKLVEQKYIKLYDSCNPKNGYNISPGGDTLSLATREKLSIRTRGKKNPMYGISRFGEKNPMHGKKHKNSTKNKISKANKGKFTGKDNSQSKSIILLNTLEVFDSISTASKKYGISPNSIACCCRGEYRYTRASSGERMVWMFLDTYNKKNDIKIDEVLIEAESFGRGENSNLYGLHRFGEENPNYGNRGSKNPLAKRVVCLNTGEIFGSIIDAELKYGIKKTSISACCRKKIKSAGKVNNEKAIWMFLDDFNNIDEQEINSIINSSNENKNFKKVICLNTLEVFDKISDIEKKYSISASNIPACCRGRQKTAGIINGERGRWMYYDDYLKEYCS